MTKIVQQRTKIAAGLLYRYSRVVAISGHPMMFLSGAGMPLEILPATIRRISDFLPLTSVVKLLRGLWFGETWGQHLLETAVLLGILGICTAVAARFFRWE
jgi:ABC-2 type transport system permease protein